MTTHALPPEFDLPPERFHAQHQLLVATIAADRRQSSRVVSWKFALVAVAILVGVLLVTPALGIGSSVLDLFANDRPPSPSEAQKQTGIAPTVHLRTEYDGHEFAVITYHDARGRACVAEQVGSSGDSGLGYGCVQVQKAFANGGSVALLGPGWMQEPNRPGFDPTMWDRMWLDGVTKPNVARVEVVMTDCSTRVAPFDPASFDGNGVFLYTVPRNDLHAGIWPYKLVAYDAADRLVASELIPRPVPSTPAAREAHTQPPVPRAECR